MVKREREESESSKRSADSIFSSSNIHKKKDPKGEQKSSELKINKREKKENNNSVSSSSTSSSNTSSDTDSDNNITKNNNNSINNNYINDPKSDTYKIGETLAGHKTPLESQNNKNKLQENQNDELQLNNISDDENDNHANGKLLISTNFNNNNNNNIRVDENVVFSDGDSYDDRFGSISSTSSDSASDKNENSNDDDIDDVRKRLLTHVQLTSTVKKSNNTKISGLSEIENGGVHLAILSNNKIKKTSSTALQHLKEELLKPVLSSALTIVNTADESHDLMESIVMSKLPPPPPEDSKKLRKLEYVDHSKIQYLHIYKDFYIIPPDVKGLSADEMKELLKELDGAKVRGRNPPRPMRSWNGSGLPDSVIDTLIKEGFKQPFAVQSLGSPALMSGRDLLITAKTGSGKTLAYILPIIRHCIGQEKCERGEGPIALILVPTHELASQIVHVTGKLCKAADLRLVGSYGLTPLADNIKQCRAGCEIMVCTPGRLLDLLTVSGGAVLSFKRVSFVVVDEADRMFDSGFMEHVEAFLKNVRPDRQLALISATMPKELKKVIMHHLQDPIEITVGGKPTPASNVEQRFVFFDEEVYEVEESNRTENKKFLKLLQILGDEGGTGEYLIVIFTQRKDECDELFARLSSCGYQKRIAVLYSGMDALDREFALEYFTPGNQFILITTGVAERGLDIPYLELVINYTLPDHYEAYVHRIGRTGRAGKKGKAISFFTRGIDDEIAAELCEGLERAQQQVPEELYERATKMREKRKEGIVRHNAGFYRGYMKAKKLKFTDRDQQAQLKAAARAAGLEEYLSASSHSDSDLSESERDGEGEIEIIPVHEDGSRTNNNNNNNNIEFSNALTIHKGVKALTIVSAQQQQKQQERLSSALAYARKTTEAAVDPNTTSVRFEAEFPINDLPELVRVRMQSAALLRSIAESTDTTIVRKGVFYDRKYKHSHKLRDGVRPLYLLLIGKTAEAVRDAVKKLNEAKVEAQNRIQKKTSALGAQL